jgi:histidine triad (HIT) family protein
MGGHTCLFCRIVARELPASVVDEDDDTLTFLDKRPLFSGHCLVVPKVHTETLLELAPERVAGFFVVVQRIARAVRDGLDAEGTFVAMNNGVSQSVPHLHVHVVPRRKKDGLRGFFWPRTTYADAEAMEAVRRRLRATIDAERT